MRMYKTDLARTKYADTDLFFDCISLNCPNGYINNLDRIVNLVLIFNKENNVKIGFAQIKMKFGFLSIYTNVPTTYIPNQRFKYDSDIIFQHTELLKLIAIICRETEKMCNICGDQLTAVVINSKVVMKCFKHYDNIDNRYEAVES